MPVFNIGPRFFTTPVTSTEIMGFAAPTKAGRAEVIPSSIVLITSAPMVRSIGRSWFIAGISVASTVGMVDTMFSTTGTTFATTS